MWSDGSPVTVEDVFFTIAWPNWYPLALKQFGLEMYRNVVGGENGTGTPIAPGTIPEGLNEDRRSHDRDQALQARRHLPAAHRRRRTTTSSPSHILGDLTAEQAESCEFCLGTAGVTIGSGPYDFETSISATGANFKRKTGYWKGTDGPVEQIVYKIQESNVSVAQLKAGELDLVIRVPPLEGPGLEGVARPPAGQRAGRRHLRHGLQPQPRPTRRSGRRSPTRSTGRRSSSRCSVASRRSTTAIPPGFRLYDDINKYEFDSARAKELLATSKMAGQDRSRLRLSRRGPELHADGTGVPAVHPGEPRHRRSSSRRCRRRRTSSYIEKRTIGTSTSRSAAARVSAGTSRRSTHLCPGLGHGLPASSTSAKTAASAQYAPQFQAAAAVTGAAQDEILHKLALDLNERSADPPPLAAQLPPRVLGSAGWWLQDLPERARVVPEDPHLDLRRLISAVVH